LTSAATRAAQSEAFGRYVRSAWPLNVALARGCVDDPLVAEIVGDVLGRPGSFVPMRLFGAVHYLVLAGRAPAYAHEEDPWPTFRSILEAERDWLREFVAEQPVQANEVQRCYALMPGFLTAVDTCGGRPLDVIELGASGGLNLLWDRYAYSYVIGDWGPPSAPFVLEGQELGCVPDRILELAASVRNRLGIDTKPVDITTEHGLRLLQAFVWADEPHRIERVREAVEFARRDPPEVVEGDFVELLPELLSARDPDALTIVFNSNSTEYLDDRRFDELTRVFERDAGHGPLAWLSLEYERGIERPEYVLELRQWPAGEMRRLALVSGHGEEIDWLE
jgi:hypothetical protein